MHRLTGISLAILLIVFGAGGAAHAALIVSGSVGGAPDGVELDNLDWLALGGAGGVSPQSGITVNFFGGAQAVQGSADGQYAAPFLSGANGAGFGNPDGPDTTTYVTSGSTDAVAGSGVELLLPDNAGVGYLYFGLLWGSVDKFNILSLFDGVNLIGTVTGNDVMGSPDGDQGVNGTLYVNIVSDTAFNRIIAQSSDFAFEFDNIAFNATVPASAVAEPPTAFLLLGIGLLALGYARRRAIV